MAEILSTPPMPESEEIDCHSRCEHGYYLKARELAAPTCRTCHPFSARLKPSEASYSLALLALQRVKTRLRTGKGQFPAEATVAPGWYRCWCCREAYPLDHHHFRRAPSKATGFQGRCKGCDNKLKNNKRRGDPRPGIQALLDVGVRL